MGEKTRIPVTQPNLERPDLHDRNTWARISRLKDAWVREVAPQLGLNIEMLMLGEIISDVVGDDENVFAWSYLDITMLDARVANNCKADLEERMSHEIETPETPAELRELLVATRDLVMGLDWQSPEGFIQVRDIWTTMKNDFRERVDNNPTYRVAENYAVNEAGKILNPYWNEFLYGKADLIT